MLYLIQIPSERKQLPKDKKRVTASARTRVSVRKSRKSVNSALDGFYLHKDKETVSNLTGVTKPSTSSNSNEVIMAMLYEIRKSNAALARSMDKVEGNNSTPINPRSHTLGQPPISPQTGSPGEHCTGLMNQIRDPLFNDGPRQSHTQPSASDACISFQPYLLPNHALQGQVTRGHQPQIQQMDSLSQPQPFL